MLAIQRYQDLKKKMEFRSQFSLNLIIDRIFSFSFSLVYYFHMCRGAVKSFILIQCSKNSKRGRMMSIKDKCVSYLHLGVIIRSLYLKHKPLPRRWTEEMQEQIVSVCCLHNTDRLWSGIGARSLYRGAAVSMPPGWLCRNLGRGLARASRVRRRSQASWVGVQASGATDAHGWGGIMEA